MIQYIGMRYLFLISISSINAPKLKKTGEFENEVDEEEAVSFTENKTKHQNILLRFSMKVT